MNTKLKNLKGGHTPEARAKAVATRARRKAEKLAQPAPGNEDVMPLDMIPDAPRKGGPKKYVRTTMKVDEAKQRRQEIALALLKFINGE